MYSTSVITIKTTEMVNHPDDSCGPGPKKNFGTKARVGHRLWGNGWLRDGKELKSGPKTQGKRETKRTKGRIWRKVRSRVGCEQV